MANETNSSQTTTQAVGAVAPVSPAIPAGTAAETLLYRQAYERVLPVAEAIRDEELLPVNVDVPSAVATAVGVLPKVMAYRADAAQLPKYDVKCFDELQLHTFAVGHAHTKFLVASAPPEVLAALNERGVALRDTMYTDATALAHRGLISGERIAGFKANVGYKNIAFDLLGLSELLRENWVAINGKTAIQMSELDEAERLGQQLMDAVGNKEQAPARIARAQAQRQRNFTLFSRSYDQVRRAISFLRWDNDDLDQICPSLYAGRGGSRRKEAPTPDPTPTTTPSTPGSTTHVAGSTAPATAPVTTSTAAMPDKPPASLGVGLPGANPFVGLERD